MAKKKSALTVIEWIAFILLVIGGLNWGLVGFFGFNLVYALFGAGIVANIIYSLVGLAALDIIYYLTKL